MSIYTIKIKEPLYFVSDFPGRKRVTPFVEEFLKHTEGAAFLNFAQTAENGEFGVGHAHVDFVGLDVVVGYGFEFCGRGCVEEFLEDGHVEFFLGVFEEGAEVGLGNTAWKLGTEKKRDAWRGEGGRGGLGWVGSDLLERYQRNCSRIW